MSQVIITPGTVRGAARWKCNGLRQGSSHHPQTSIGSPELSSSYNWKFVPFDQPLTSSMPQPVVTTVLWFYEFDCFRLHMWMRSCRIRLSLSGSFLFARCPQVHPRCHTGQDFILFQGRIISQCIYTHRIFFIHSSINGHLDCFHVLAIMTNAAVNTGVQMVFQDTDFVSFGRIHSSGIAGSHSSSVFNLGGRGAYILLSIMAVWTW